MKITSIRKRLGHTQTEFGKIIGASRDTVASWETGRNPISKKFATRIAFVSGKLPNELARQEDAVECLLVAALWRRRTPELWFD